MKKICIMFFIFYLSLWTTLSYGFGDEWQNIKYEYMGLVPPPPSMDAVPFYVQSTDYEIYSDTYYKCMLNYEYNHTCTYWHQYAKEHNIELPDIKHISQEKHVKNQDNNTVQIGLGEPVYK